MQSGFSYVASSQASYGLSKNLCTNETQINTKFEFSRGDVDNLTLFYQPVIHSDKKEHGVDLRRVDDGGSCWQPDYYIKYEHAGVTKRIILDAKFSKASRLKVPYKGKNLSQFEACVRKYRYLTNADDGSRVNAMWLISGREDGKRRSQCFQGNMKWRYSDGIVQILAKDPDLDLQTIKDLLFSKDGLLNE